MALLSLVECISICAADYPEEVQLRVAVMLTFETTDS